MMLAPLILATVPLTPVFIPPLIVTITTNVPVISVLKDYVIPLKRTVTTMTLVLMNIVTLQLVNVLLQLENVTIITYVHKTLVPTVIVSTMNHLTNAMTTMLAQLILVAHLLVAFTPLLTAMITMHVLKTPVILLADV
jgi:hypothetical protein